MKKALPLIALFIVFMFMYFGNSDKKSVEKRAYVSAIGIEKSDSEEEDEYKYIFYIPKSPDEGGSSEKYSGSTSQSSSEKNSSESKKYSKISIIAKTIFSAMDLANNSFSNTVSLSHVKIILFSDKLSKDDIDKNVDSTFKNTLFRHTSFVAITSKKVEDVFDNLDYETQTKQDSYFDFVKNSYETTGLTSVTRLADYYKESDSHSERAVLTYIGYDDDEKTKKNDESKESTTDKEKNNKTKTDNKSQEDDMKVNTFTADNSPIEPKKRVSAVGLVVFDNSKQIGKLDGQMCVYYNILKGKLLSSMTSIPSVDDTKKILSFCAKSYGMPKIKVKIENNKPKIDINVNLIAFISFDESKTIQNNNGDINKVQEYLEKYFKEQILDFLKYTTKEIQADVVGFGEYSKINFMTIEDFNNFNWNEKYKDSEFELKVNVNLSECRI